MFTIIMYPTSVISAGKFLLRIKCDENVEYDVNNAQGTN